jgi:hypothetical protein
VSGSSTVPPLDRGGACGHGAAMNSAARNRFFGICREIISA